MDVRTKWAETHPPCDPFDCVVLLSAPNPDEPTEIPASGKVGIQHQRPVKQCNAAVQIAAQVRQDMSACCQSDGIVLAQFHRATGKARALCLFALEISHPPTQLAPGVAPGSHGI